MDVPPEPLPAQEQVIEQRLIDCGLDPSGLSVKYEDYLQSIEIVISTAAKATPDHFACIKEAAGDEIVMFQDVAMSTAYMDFASELARPGMMVVLEGQLKDAGLWAGFPDRDDFGSVEKYVAALEIHSGTELGSALRVSGDHIIFDPPNASQNPAAFAKRYADLLLVVAYASLRDRLKFGVIGNQRVAD
jgi:hypothetical protein